MSNITNISKHYANQVPSETAGTERLNRGANQVSEQREHESTPKDIVTISGSSREMRIAKEAVQAAPEVRMERVEALRSAIHEGRYNVDAEKVAEKLIGTIISERV